MKKNKIIESIGKKINTLNCEYFFGLVGSAVENKNYNDIDFLLITDISDSIVEDICRVFKDFSINRIDDAIRISNFCECEVSIAIYNLKKVSDITNNFITGKTAICEHRSWALGYWIPEAFIYDLSQTQIIKDNDNQFLNIQNRVKKYSIYGRKKIVRDCIEEIEIKKVMFYNTLNEIEKNMIINDIIFCIIRGYKAMNNEYLKGFKKLDSLINNLPSHLVQAINNIFNKDLISLNEITDLYKKYLWSNSIYLGTWQFSGDFKKLNDTEVLNLIAFAKNIGIRNFDTALVYGNGNVEKLLGQSLTCGDTIVTKIPAKIKPNSSEMLDLSNYYTEEYILDCVKKSLKNLNKDVIDTILLHNWSEIWNNEIQIIEWLLKLKELGIAKKVGISLPNNYSSKLPDSILEKIDVIEAPYNDENKWILKYLGLYKSYNIEIILRSLFIQGKLLANKSETSYVEIIEEAQKLDTSLVIGMTTEEQIRKNIDILKI